MNKYNTVEEYISSLGGIQKAKIEELRELLKKILPEAKEIISYSMPAFKGKKVILYYAAQKNHIGFYPTPTGINNFYEELKEFKSSKGAIQFPYDKPLPIELISKIALFRLNEDNQ